jgi:branched-subunit amino acid aminotransferase/4-amino-4-deoxychorismate lyase
MCTAYWKPPAPTSSWLKGKLITPASGILNGITGKFVLQLRDMPVDEGLSWKNFVG